MAKFEGTNFTEKELREMWSAYQKECHPDDAMSFMEYVEHFKN